MIKIIRIVFLGLLVFVAGTAGAQTIRNAQNERVNPDSLVKATPVSSDRRIDSVLRNHSPRKAAIRSAILPGLGQIYNKKYWKLPLVYAAVGIPAGILVYNLTWYRRTREAYKILSTGGDPTLIHPKLQGYVQFNNTAGLQQLRNEFRRNVDYSILFTALFWGLQVVDASVDAHLKTFDISPDLSLRFKAGYSEMANTNGVSLVLTFN